MPPHFPQRAVRRGTRLRPERFGVGGLIARRILQGAVVVFGAITISFGLIHLTGNPAQVLVGGSFSQKQVDELTRRLGYNRPLLTQYVDYVWHVLRGQFGQSFRYQEPAIRPVLSALPHTLVLVGGAVFVASLLAVPMAVFSVLYRERWLDRVLRRVLILAQGVPEFWLGLMLALLFAVRLHWVPSIGDSGVRSILLPVAALALPLSPMLMRLLRANLLDTMAADFVVALRGKGLTEPDIVWRHGMRNALVPFITFLGLQVGWLVGGTIIIENVFAWPGIGLLALSAVQVRDLTVIQAIVIVIAISYVVVNLVVDLIVLSLDPRIRISGASNT